MALQQAHCLLCGDKVKHNPRAVGRMSTQYGEPARPLSGWHHDDPSARKRDHEAIPHDFRSAEDEGIRAAAVKNRARVSVNKHLDQQFMGLAVDDVFRDRR